MDNIKENVVEKNKNIIRTETVQPWKNIGDRMRQRDERGRTTHVEL